MKDFHKLREELQSQQIVEDKHYGTEVGPETHNTDHPAVSKHVDSAMSHVRKTVSHAKKQGYKVNHKNEGGGAIGKQHSKPDVTVYGNDDGDTSYTVHAGGAAHKDKVMHSSKHDIKHDSKMDKHMYESVAIEEDHEYGIGFSKKSYNAGQKGLAHLKKSGLKVNHGDQGNKPGSKPHKKPDATVHYEIGDKPHRDGASGVTLHSKAAKSHAAAAHFKTADKHFED